MIFIRCLKEENNFQVCSFREKVITQKLRIGKNQKTMLKLLVLYLLIHKKHVIVFTMTLILQSVTHMVLAYQHSN